jgi:DNA (cytosine-5)-methyltransferase 1
MKGVRACSDVSEWPIRAKAAHLSGFLEYDVAPLSKKATSGFLSRLVKSSLKYEEAFEDDLAHHVENIEKY